MSMPTSEIYQGLACHRLTLPEGDTVLVALQGAHVLSWVSEGRERLFLSPNNLWDGHSAIRGGVPVCFPQFNQRGTLPKHGFARNTLWQASEAVTTEGGLYIDLTLRSDANTLAMWSQHFEAQLRVALTPAQLTLTLTVHNTEAQQDLLFTGALHTYLAVDDIDLTDLQGLGLRPEWDAVADVHGVADSALYFDGEFDRVYEAAPQALTLQDGSGRLQIEQSSSWGQSVVWNPGATKCATLSDMSPDGYQRMLCVEAAQVYEPIRVDPSQTWQGWQRLSLV